MAWPLHRGKWHKYELRAVSPRLPDLVPARKAALAARVRNEDAMSAHDQGAGAEIGEELEQHRMRHLAIENHHALNPGVERIDTGLHLWNHAAGDGALGNKAAGVGHRELLDQI